jgi:hypothetical protein
VLVCDIPIKTSQDYSDVPHAFGFSAREELGRPPILRRKVLVKNVKNEIKFSKYFFYTRSIRMVDCKSVLADLHELGYSEIWYFLNSSQVKDT